MLNIPGSKHLIDKGQQSLLMAQDKGQEPSLTSWSGVTQTESGGPFDIWSGMWSYGLIYDIHLNLTGVTEYIGLCSLCVCVCSRVCVCVPVPGGGCNTTATFPRCF